MKQLLSAISRGAWLVAVLFVVSKPVQSQTDRPDVRIFPSSNAQSENSIAIDPANHQNMLICTNGKDGDTFTRFYTTNRGASWSGSDLNPSGVSYGYDPVAFFDYSGNAFCGFIGSQGHSTSILRSTDHGATWGNEVSVLGNSPSSSVDKPDFLADISGTRPECVWAAWTGNDAVSASSTVKRIYVNRSTDGGITFANGEPTRMENYPGHGAALSVGPTGDLYVAWARLESETSVHESQIRMKKSTDGGWTFSDYHSWNISGVSTSDGSGQSEYNGIRVNSFPSVAVDCSGGQYSGRVYVAYADAGTGDANIKLRISSQWATPVTVNNDPDGTQQYFPSVTVDQATGTVIVSYSSITGPSFGTKRVVAYSTDGGVTFQRYDVSDVSYTTTPTWNNYMGDYYEVAAADGIAFSTWSDNRTGTFQAYVSPFSLPVDCQVSQTLENGDSFGTVGRWDGTVFQSIQSGSHFIGQSGQTEGLRSDQSANTSLNQKYFKWDQSPNVVNHQGFLILGGQGNFTARFRGYAMGISIRNKVMDIPGVFGGIFSLKDPWLIDYPDPAYGNALRNRG